MSSQVLQLCQGLPLKKLSAGENLITQGGHTPQIAVLKSGLVEVLKDRQSIAAVSQPGAIFGEMAVILDAPHNASIRAVELSEFYIIKEPSSFFWEKPEFLWELLKVLANRLDQVDQKLADRKQDKNETVELIEATLSKALHQSD